jgi:hypothetical protein
MRWLSGGFITIYMLVLVSMMMVGLMLYSIATPFDPLHVEKGSYEVLDNSVCPGEMVQASADAELAPKMQVMFSLDPYWYNPQTHEFLDEGQATYSIPNGEDSLPEDSDIVIEAPNEPGLWLLTLRVTVDGRKGILPRQQVLHLSASKPLSVEDCGEVYTYDDYLER